MKTTDDLSKTLSSASSIDDYLKENEADLTPTPFIIQLEQYLADRNLKRSDLIKQMLIDRRYVYNLFDGSRKNPSREIVLQLCLAMKLSVSEANHLLNAAGVNELYARSPFDSVIIYCLQNQISLTDCNSVLEQHNLPFFKGKE